MNRQAISKDKIELSLPMNAAYVSAARLTASSIANRLGFDIDEIEDIKAAVSETCTYIINQAANSSSTVFTINFIIQENHLDIKFTTDIQISPKDLSDEMSLLMVKALMSSMNIEVINDNCTEITIAKSHTPTNF